MSLPTGTHACIRIYRYLIFPETTVIGLHFCRGIYGSIFIQICGVGSKNASFLHQIVFWPFKVVQGHQGTNRKRVYDFLLVGHCDYGPILHRFRHMVTYWLKMAYFATFLLPLSHTAPSLPMFPLEFRTEVNRQDTRVMGYRPVKTA